MLSLLMLIQAAAAPVSGTIVFYRGSTVWGAAAACPIRYKGVELVELGRGRFAEWRVPPGRYMLTNKQSGIEVNVDAGETRYVRCQVKGGIATGGAELQIVDRETFEKRQGDFTRKDVASPAA